MKSCIILHHIFCLKCEYPRLQRTGRIAYDMGFITIALKAIVMRLLKQWYPGKFSAARRASGQMSELFSFPQQALHFMAFFLPLYAKFHTDFRKNQQKPIRSFVRLAAHFQLFFYRFPP